MSGKPRVLYIDDDEALRRLVSRALQRRGYDVDVAASGANGVSMALARSYDLIAVDHYMPGQDGIATLEELRKIPNAPPVVYVTGSEESRIAVAALKAGAADYVVKTIGDEFFDLLESALNLALRQVDLQRDKEAAEDALRASNERLQALLREVNHRVANSLQMVSAFVHMQARDLTDDGAKTALEDTQRRITAIAQVHRRLYTSDNVESIDVEEYLTAMISELEDTWSTPTARRTLVLSADPIQLHPDKAVALGVIVNELVSNACKYAYLSVASGEVRIDISRDGDQHFLLQVEDDGCGMQGDEIKGTGLGKKLIGVMATTLNASVAYDPKHDGVRAILRGAI